MAEPHTGLPERRAPDCAIRYEGQDVPAITGEPIAVALVAAGNRVLSRSIKYHRPRSFFCLAGHCNGCLMRVGGVPNVKACRAPVVPGLEIERQNAFPSGSFDMLGATDWFFPKGMDHHTLMTSSTALNALMKRVVREVSGLGKLPDAATDLTQLPAGQRRHVDIAIIGAGPAGLSAAISCARMTKGNKSILVIDESDRPGGSLLSHPDFGVSRADTLVGEARNLGIEFRARSPVFGWFPEDEGGVLGIDSQGSLLRLTAGRYLYATGGYDVNALFADNDRPGICAARAVGTLLLRHGVIPARRPLILGHGEYAEALERVLTAAGAKVSRVDNRSDKAISSRGLSWVSGLDVENNGQSRKISCDLIAVVEPPAPASELARMHGAEVAFSIEGGGFSVITDSDGRTQVPGIFSAGDVCGYRGVKAALEQGDKVGRAIAASFEVDASKGAR